MIWAEKARFSLLTGNFGGERFAPDYEHHHSLQSLVNRCDRAGVHIRPYMTMAAGGLRTHIKGLRRRSGRRVRIPPSPPATCRTP